MADGKSWLDTFIREIMEGKVPFDQAQDIQETAMMGQFAPLNDIVRGITGRPFMGQQMGPAPDAEIMPRDDGMMGPPIFKNIQTPGVAEPIRPNQVSSAEVQLAQLGVQKEEARADSEAIKAVVELMKRSSPGTQSFAMGQGKGGPSALAMGMDGEASERSPLETKGSFSKASAGSAKRASENMDGVLPDPMAGQRDMLAFLQKAVVESAGKDTSDVPTSKIFALLLQAMGYDAASILPEKKK